MLPAELLLEGPRAWCGWEQGRSLASVCLVALGTSPPLTPMHVWAVWVPPCSRGSLPAPLGSSASRQGFRLLGLATVVWGASFGPPCHPCLPRRCLAVGTGRAWGREGACSCGGRAAAGWEDPRCRELGRTGAHPRAQPGWPRPSVPSPPPPLFTVSGTLASRARSPYEAGHVFSFSPDNDSRWLGAVSRHAHLLCGAALPQARPRPQRRGQS